MANLLLTRIASELVYKTIKAKIIEDIGFIGEDIYLQAPPHIYVNDRTETTDNIEQNRYPALAIFPEDCKFRHTHNNQVIQQDSYTSTGQVKIWTSDIEVEQDIVFCMETTTKKDFRKYFEYLTLWFSENRNGFTIINDILPEREENFNLVLLNSKNDIEQTPYLSIFYTTCYFRLFKEKLNYLMLSYEVSGKIYQDGHSIYVNNELII